MLNQLMRYNPILDFIKKNRYETILEVGSGSSGIAKYYTQRFIVGCDIDFSDYSEGECQIKKNLIPIRCSAEYLPFVDGSFELVISSDTIEHIELTVRENAIKELYRVADKVVFLTFPCGEKSLDYDRRLKNYYELVNRKIPIWLTEHLKHKFPSEKDISSILYRNNFEYFVENNENLVIHYLVMVLESLPHIGQYLSAIANLIGQEDFSKEKNTYRMLFVELMFRPFRKLLEFLNFGETYRKIFIISKRCTKSKGMIAL